MSDLARHINLMKPSETQIIDRHLISSLPGNWITGQSGWERVLENVVGSSHADLWSFQEVLETGDMRVTRLFKALKGNNPNEQ